MKSRGKQGKTGEKSQDTGKFAPPNYLVRNSHHPTPFLRNCLCEHFPKSMLSVPTQNLSAKIHRNAKLVRNSHHPIRHSGKVASAGCKSYSEIRTTLLHWCKIRTTIPPLCEIAFVSIFQKACSRSLTKISVQKCTGM